MANFNFEKARATAERLIKKFGGPLDVIKEGSDHTKDAFGNVTEKTDPVIISGFSSPLLPYSSETKKDSFEQTGTEVIAGDKFNYFHSDVLPEIGMSLTVEGVKYRIQSITGLGSIEGIRVYTKLQLRS